MDERTAGEQEQALFPTAPEEVFQELNVGKDKGTLEHRFEPFGLEDWAEYLDADPRTVFRSREKRWVLSAGGAATDELWRRKIRQVRGYGEGEPPENWRELIPVAHKAAALTGLAQVRIVDVRSGTHWGAALSSTVRLEAVRNGCRYQVSIRLRTPSNSEEIDWNRMRAGSTSIEQCSEEIGGEKLAGSKTVDRTPLVFLCGFFDRLFESAEGYDRNTASSIDPLHKRAAVEALMEEALGNVELGEVKPAAAASPGIQS